MFHGEMEIGMTGKVYTGLGLNSIDMGIVFLAIAGLLFVLLSICIVLIIELSKLKKRYERFSAGRDAKSLEKEIGGIFIENAALKDQAERNKRDIRNLYRKMETTFQKIGLVKYDAFPQMGGKLSFSLALLDEKDNGFILNSVHGSDGCYTYSKEIKSGVCDLTLGEEEKEALKLAMQK